MMSLKSGNIYQGAVGKKSEEAFKTLVKNKNLHIERIVSCGQKTPEGVWLKQAHDEWVIILKGAGKLSFQGKRGVVSLKEGDYIFIPSDTAHRVEWTHPRKKTVWLAAHTKSVISGKL
ncbi:MAG: cupin domain-containing protein [Candidatus Omnitrophota bacterium]|jgi:cupin 2 domain-containing protein